MTTAVTSMCGLEVSWWIKTVLGFVRKRGLKTEFLGTSTSFWANFKKKGEKERRRKRGKSEREEQEARYVPQPLMSHQTRAKRCKMGD
jgi:hypothetical protein